jgi:very-short-patch-repair endonuclease
MARGRKSREILRAIPAKSHSLALDAALAVLAAAQYGVVSRRQLLEIGFSRDAIAHRLAVKRLHRLYAVGHTRVCREGRWLAAVLACGEDAVLSHRSAAALWGIRDYNGRIDVTAPHAHRLGKRITPHRLPLGADERTSHRGIPTTTVERTLLDLGAVLEPHQLDKAVREADYLGIADFAQVQRLLERYPRKRSTADLRTAIETATATLGRTRSELEDRFRALVLDADLPTPRFNETIALDADTTIEADAVWPEHKVIVELDGWGAHSTRARFVSDRSRDRKAHVAGYVVMRYTSADIAGGAAAELDDLLSARTPRGSGRLRSGAPPW